MSTFAMSGMNEHFARAEAKREVQDLNFPPPSMQWPPSFEPDGVDEHVGDDHEAPDCAIFYRLYYTIFLVRKDQAAEKIGDQ
ncbi:hypothetical protein ACIPIN_13965 [Pseudomonas sp. NPDC087697]|uniref:hypothetical protein n=1 Tax=Pseudomonas sp. NPDC087697 TaxID=3364447 RepID=UPI0038270E11